METQTQVSKLPVLRIPISPEITCWLRIGPVKQGENNRDVFGVTHLSGRLVHA